MPTSNHKTIAAHRKRLKEQGLARIEVQVPKQDAELIRNTAQLLRGEAAVKLRLQLQRLVGGKHTGLKELLAAAPLDDIELTRNPDLGRSVEL